MPPLMLLPLSFMIVHIKNGNNKSKIQNGLLELNVTDEHKINPLLWVSAEPVGRLGNQLFIAAASYGIAQKRKARWCLGNTGFIDNAVEWIRKPEPCPENLGQFVSLHEAHKYGAYVASLIEDRPEKNVTVGMYLQSFKYFRDYEVPFRLNTENWGKQWTKEKSIFIGIHIRRGDYLTDNYHEGLTPPIEYYTAAIEYIKNKLRKEIRKSSFFVASDDISWVKSQSVFDGMVITQEGFRPEEDMAILSACEHLILSAGTFSWWSAYLSNSNKQFSDSIKIYYSEPNREWKREFLVPKDHYPSEWIGINNTLISEIINEI